MDTKLFIATLFEIAKQERGKKKRKQSKGSSKNKCLHK
jgi:hypothetical protein